MNQQRANARTEDRGDRCSSLRQHESSGRAGGLAGEPEGSAGRQKRIARIRFEFAGNRYVKDRNQNRYAFRLSGGGCSLVRNRNSKSQSIERVTIKER